MPNITIKQSDFTIGEVAPDVQLRASLEARNRGVKTLTNFIPDAHGPVSRRTGFRFLGKVGTPRPPLVQQMMITGRAMNPTSSQFAKTPDSQVFNWEKADPQPQVDLVSFRDGLNGRQAGIGNGQLVYTDNKGQSWNSAGTIFEPGSSGGAEYIGQKELELTPGFPATYPHVWFLWGEQLGGGNRFQVKYTPDFVNFVDGYTDADASFPSPVMARNGDTWLLAGDDTFIASKLRYSTDAGDTWNLVDTPFNTRTNRVWYHNGAWYVGCDGSDFGRLFRTTSIVPTTGWDERFSLGRNRTFAAIEFGIVDNVADRALGYVNASGGPFLYWSPDNGLNWGEAPGTNIPPVAAQGEGLDYSPEFGWLLVSNDVAYSSLNGLDWTDVSPGDMLGAQCGRWVFVDP